MRSRSTRCLRQPIRLADIGDWILQRVARQEQASAGHEQHRAVMAVDLDLAQLDGDRSDGEVKHCL